MNLKILLLIICAGVMVSCKEQVKIQYFEIEINQNWLFRNTADTTWHIAGVPGNSTLDLVNNEIIDSLPALEMYENIKPLFNINWEYKTTFDVPRDILREDSIYIQFDGIAGFAEVYINNHLFLSTKNMFLNYRVPCKKVLKEFNNQLVVKFINHPDSVSRKAPCLNGSEINPEIPFQGIWKPVKLIAWSEAIINNLYFKTTSVTIDNATIEATVETESSQEGAYTLYFETDRQSINNGFDLKLKPGKQIHKFNISIANPQLWWCNGMGKPNLYGIKTVLLKNNTPIYETYQTFGIRKTELIEQTDSLGFNFYFKLNNKPVFIKGGAWLPLSFTDANQETTRYEDLIKKVKEANINLLRVWGGGIYENERFYELCDQNGIMVWQELPLSVQQITQPLISRFMINREIEQNLVRLRNHPSLVFLFANPDIDTYAGYKQTKKQTDTIATQFFENQMAANIQNICKIPYYIPHTNKKNLPVLRDWRVWYEAAPLLAYTESEDGFIMEYGMQSLMDENYLNIKNNSDNEFLIPAEADKYQYCNLPWLGPDMDGNKLLLDYLQMYYNIPVDYSTAVYLSQLLQAEALKTAIETHRLRKPFVMGSIFWHFNDCWPGISWSVTDYHNHPKPAYFAIKNAFKNIILVPERLYGDIRVWLVNDSAAQFNTECTITLYHFSGKVLYSKKINTQAQADQTQILWLMNEKNLYKEKYANKVFLNMQLTRNNKIIDEKFLYFTEPRFLDLPVPDITFSIEAHNTTQYKIILSTSYFAKNVQLSVNGTDTHFSDNYFDMLPGRNYEIITDFTGKKEELENNLKINSLIDSY